MNRLRWGLRVAVIAGTLALCGPARAQGTVGGMGVGAYTEVGAAVTLRDVAVKARLQKGAALTDTTLIFDHELKAPAQMTVNVTVSKDTVITGYSYWFKDEQIDAKLLDNDQAWEIYRTVTSRGRDPAIMEQWGETDYHFQIYPVEPGKELKMVLHTVAPWEGDADGFYYRPPLPTTGSPLKSYEAEIRVLGAGTQRPRDNYIGAFHLESGGPVYRLRRDDWQPDRDWRIRLTTPRGELALLGSGGRSGGREGFFYLLIAPSRRIGPARLGLEGVRTRLVMPAATGGLEKGFPWL
ncbi:MAG TPA: VIT domain-containing protein, partial [Armatimonadota bacterium]|nr:VIT domain-containing protein [Armatimonadota bacterium]